MLPVELINRLRTKLIPCTLEYQNTFLQKSRHIGYLSYEKGVPRAEKDRYASLFKEGK